MDGKSYRLVPEEDVIIIIQAVSSITKEKLDNKMGDKAL